MAKIYRGNTEISKSYLGNTEFNKVYKGQTEIWSASPPNPTFSGRTSNLILHLDAGHTDSYPGTGTTWYDLTSNSYDFTFNKVGSNYPSWTSATTGNTTYNIMSTTYTDASFFERYNSTPFSVNNFSIEMWVYDRDGSENYGMYWSNDPDLTSPYYYQQLRSAYGYGLTMHWYVGYNGTDWIYKSSSGFPNNATVGVGYNTWNHWVLTYNSSNGTGILYKNGSSAESVSSGAARTPQYGTPSTRYTFIGAGWQGARSTTSTSYHSNLEISEVRFYNATISASDVSGNYNATKSRYGIS